MSKMRKITALVLALAMAMAMSLTTFAATVTVPASDNHSYAVYQIFTGDLNGSVLSNVKWGQNGTGTLGEAVPSTTLEALTALTNSTVNSTKLEEIKKVVNLDSTPFTTVTNAEAANLPAGYYLFKDAASLKGEDDAATTFITLIVKDQTISRKAVKPSVDKQVQDEAADKDTKSNDANGWGETADHAINESFQFKLVATLPADPDYADYETYKVVFHDTMSTGVTFESIESVDINGTAISNYGVNGVAAGEAGKTWTLTIADAKTYDVDLTAGATITVVYNAHLNENAQVNDADGSTINENTVSLEYSNNPNASGSGDNETGETPEDHVWVFTYGVNNTKIDGVTEQPLPNAGFKLYSDANCTTEVPVIWDATLNAYRLAKTDETGVEMTTPANGIFNIKGLDTGVYYLKETTTPAGYNTCPVKTVTIGAAHEESQDGTTNSVTFTTDSTLNNTIENNQGATLPETGGMGTTMFYLIGALCVLGAGVLLISRKRVAR